MSIGPTKRSAARRDVRQLRLVQRWLRRNPVTLGLDRSDLYRAGNNPRAAAGPVDVFGSPVYQGARQYAGDAPS